MKQQDYTFSSSTGIFNSRFIIKINKKFVPSIKQKNNAELLSFYSNNSNIHILNNSTEQINDALFTLIDLQGRIIHQQKFDILNGQTITITIDTQEGIFISTVKYGAKIITKKIYIK